MMTRSDSDEPHRHVRAPPVRPAADLLARATGAQLAERLDRLANTLVGDRMPRLIGGTLEAAVTLAERRMAALEAAQWLADRMPRGSSWATAQAIAARARRFRAGARFKLLRVKSDLATDEEVRLLALIYQSGAREETLGDRAIWRLLAARN